MDFSFKTIGEFYAYFSSEEKCYRFLEDQRWGGSPNCPKCGNEKLYNVKSRTKFDIPTYRCSIRNCDALFTVRTGSIYEGSKIELLKWFQAIYELSTSKKGISSVELATRLGVSQKTAWFMNHRIREMLGVTANDEPMGEGGQAVEIDETYVGGKLKNMSNKKRKLHKEGKLDSNSNKTPVMAYFVRGGALKLHVEPDRKLLQASVLKHVSPEAVLITDGAGMYPPLAKYFAGHETVDHAKGEYKRDFVHTNTVEGVFSILDRAIIGIFHFVSPKHLQKYCDEISLKYNGRAEGNISTFLKVVKNSNVQRITYRELTK